MPDVKLIIVEPSASGHRMVYVRYLITETARRGVYVRLVTHPSATKHQAFKELQAQYSDHFELDFFDPIELPTAPTIGRQWVIYKMFLSYFRKRDVPFVPVFMPYFEHFEKIVSLLPPPFGNRPWGGIVMHYKFHYAKMGIVSAPGRGDRLKQIGLFKILRDKHLTQMFTIDEPLYNYLADHRQLASRISYVADPTDLEGTESRESSRQFFGIPLNLPIILLFGALTNRKGVAELLAAASGEALLGRVGVLLVGDQDAEVKKIVMEADAEKLREHNMLFTLEGFQPSENAYRAFRASDISWVAYNKWPGMSSVLIHSAAFGLPVVTTRYGLLGWLTEKHGLGIITDAQDPESASKAISELINNPDARKTYGQNGLNLANDYTARKFASKILDVMMH